MGNLSLRPFTELYECVQREYVRDSGTDNETEEIYKSAVNTAYMVDLAYELDEKYLKTETSVATTADYSTGTVDISASGTTIGAGDTAPAWTSAVSNNMLFKEASSDIIYRVAYSSSTELDLSSPSTWLEDAVDEGSYYLVQDRYALASDFGRMCEDMDDNGQVVYYWTGGHKAFLDPLDNDDYDDKFTSQAGTPYRYTVKWISGVPYLYITPPDTDSRYLFYSYMPHLSALTEYATGTASCDNASTAVTGSGTDYDGYLNATDTFYLRFDGDGVGSASVWYEISTYSGDTSITLDSNYGGATKSGAAYTVSKVSKWPASFDMAIIYKAAINTDPDNTSVNKWVSLYDGLMDRFKSADGKRIGGKKIVVDMSWRR